MDIQGGTLLRGRFFTRGELSGDEVMVIETDVADRLFGDLDPLGRYVRVGATALRVIGIYQKPDNIFEPPGQQIGGVVPFETARQNYRYDETNNLFIAVRPRPGQDPAAVRDLATVALRRVRNLRPGMPNTFDLITQDQILDVVGKFTTYFFLAMVSLSSVALLVGGIGVMAIMMVSVTDRTREIGLRKALGATRREILWQFLVEAATLTLIGGLVGIVFGLGAGELHESRARPPLRGAALERGPRLRREHRHRAGVRALPGQPGRQNGPGRGAPPRMSARPSAPCRTVDGVAPAGKPGIFLHPSALDPNPSAEYPCPSMSWPSPPTATTSSSPAPARCCGPWTPVTAPAFSISRPGRPGPGAAPSCGRGRRTRPPACSA